MPKSHLPTVMRPVSASQLVANAREGSHRTAGSMSLQTNRGNTIEYPITANIAPPPITIVRDTGERVMGDGMQWIVVFMAPELISGTYDSGLRARIIYGEGGARQTLEVDASPGFSIAIPATSIDVQVFSATNPPINADSVNRVTALLYRGVPADAGNAHVAIDVPAGTQFTTIPQFARTLGVMGNGDAASVLSPIFAATATLDIITSGIGSVIRWDNAALLAMFKAGQRIVLPGGSRQILTNTPGGLPFVLDFDVQP